MNTSLYDNFKQRADMQQTHATINEQSERLQELRLQMQKLVKEEQALRKRRKNIKKYCQRFHRLMQLI
jgi:division protein CdvB (Snf7/Vps24/ESCRT-III family)